MENQEPVDFARGDAIAEVSEPNLPPQWEWILQQDPPHFSVGDKILFEGRELILASQKMKANGWVESIWEDVA